jgi:hypothetical protein
VIVYLAANSHVSLRDVRPEKVGILPQKEDADLHDLPADCICYLFEK